nr:hypothetical protein CFP56_08862 [Quercus suber]
MQALATVQASSTICRPQCNHGRIFNYMSPIYNPPPTPAIVAALDQTTDLVAQSPKLEHVTDLQPTTHPAITTASRLNHRSRRPKA